MTQIISICTRRVLKNFPPSNLKYKFGLILGLWIVVSSLDTLANVGFVFGQGLAFAFIFCMVERGSFLSKRARTCSGLQAFE